MDSIALVGIRPRSGPVVSIEEGWSLKQRARLFPYPGPLQVIKLAQDVLTGCQAGQRQEQVTGDEAVAPTTGS